MKKLLLAFALAICGIAGGALLTAPLQAQPDGRYEGGMGYGDPYGDGFTRGNNFPGGSWRESCRAPVWQGRFLFAQCRSSNDRWVNARIDPDACAGRRLLNDDGRLICEGSSGGWGQGAGWSLPGGTWRQSCRYPVMRGRYLSAQCQTENGSWRSSSVDSGQCSGSISNENGRLLCEGGYGGGYGGGPGWGEGQYPAGTWSQSCRNSSMRGRRLSAQCSDRSGRYIFSSIIPGMCRSNRVGNDDGRLVCE